MVIVARAGDVPEDLIGQRVDLQDSVAGAALRTLTTLRLEEGPNRARFERHGLGGRGLRASAGLVVPLVFRGTAQGALIAIDRLQDGPSFGPGDQRLLEAFAASAATAIATAESVRADRRRQRLAAAEQERTRWARELHDETLQSLAGLRIGLAAQLRDPKLESITDAVRETVAQLEGEIQSLRALITDLRPGALDDLGTEAAIKDLADRARGRGLEVDLAIDFAYEQGREPDRHTAELETAIYRTVQEALNNILKHGAAQRASVEINEDETTVRVTVRDDGQGFDPSHKASGFGLIGMRERAELVHGTIEIDSSPGHGTTVRAGFPVQRRGHADRRAVQ